MLHSLGRRPSPTILVCWTRSYLDCFCCRNKLKAWILRHLVASNGDADLMAKAIALHHEENLNGVGSASKGAVGRESFISGRVSRLKKYDDGRTIGKPLKRLPGFRGVSLLELKMFAYYNFHSSMLEESRCKVTDG